MSHVSKKKLHSAALFSEGLLQEMDPRLIWDRFYADALPNTTLIFTWDWDQQTNLWPPDA